MQKDLPDDLLKSLKSVEGFNESNFVAAHKSPAQIVSIRLNPDKLTFGDERPFAEMESVPWSSNGFYLPERPFFTFDPLLHAGAYYVQEASSMFIEQCLQQHADLSSSIKVLDLCAAPGGKSTLIQSVMNKESLLVSNEVIKARVNVLVENLSKWGAANVIVTNNDPRDFKRIENFFDVMVVDAPCSGSGLFRRDPDAINEWSPSAVEMCSHRQQRILTDAYDGLKKDGLLIYSTCSYSRQEDEDICDWLIDNFSLTPLPLSLEPDWGVVETHSERHAVIGYRFFPDRVKGEGFFVACFRKNGGAVERPLMKKSKLSPVSRADAQVISPWLKDPQQFAFFYLDKEVFAFPKNFSEELSIIHANLYVRKAGVLLGKLINGELVPAHELAVSAIVNKNLPSVSLKKEDALQYLRKEEVTLVSDKRGWALVQYNGHNLGWIKLLGNRSNNYYPKEWRILKSGNN